MALINNTESKTLDILEKFRNKGYNQKNWNLTFEGLNFHSHVMTYLILDTE